jgi:adenosylcobinamide-GDP ribazoletransferase
MMKKWISQLRSALLFITILPAGKNVDYEPVGMIRWFPVVGLILGLLLAGVDSLASLFWPPGVAAFLDVLFLVIITGAFHLDGLGDTADGMFSHRPKERVLEIMKDSRTGMMGLVAVFCILAVKACGIYSIKIGQTGFQTAGLLLVIPAYARGAMIFGIRFLEYGRKGTGTGLAHFNRPLGVTDFSLMLIPLALTLFAGYQGLVVNLVFLITLFLILGFYKIKLNCITGDMLGALCEVMEAVLFLAAGAAVVRF